LRITSAVLPAAYQMSRYETVLRAEGGKLPYRWKLVSGDLPLGLEFDPDRGVISGLPENLGTTELTFSVTDAEGGTAEKAFTLEVLFPGFAGNGEGLRITTLSLPPATRGQLYSFRLTAEGGKPPYNWTVSQGNLPPSLTLDSVSGEIEGEPEIIDPEGTVFAVLVSDRQYESLKTLPLFADLTVVYESAPVPRLGLAWLEGQGPESEARALAGALLITKFVRPRHFSAIYFYCSILTVMPTMSLN
jgi:hypothetical protein